MLIGTNVEQAATSDTETTGTSYRHGDGIGST